MCHCYTFRLRLRRRLLFFFCLSHEVVCVCIKHYSSKHLSSPFSCPHRIHHIYTLKTELNWLTDWVTKTFIFDRMTGASSPQNNWRSCTVATMTHTGYGRHLFLCTESATHKFSRHQQSRVKMHFWDTFSAAATIYFYLCFLKYARQLMLMTDKWIYGRTKTQFIYI